MTATDDDAQKVPTGRDAIDRLRSAGALDGLFEQIDAGQVKMTGADGLLPALVKEALERGLAAELTEHLGYDRGEPTSQARGNARNGTTSNTVDSEVGPFEIEVPRDRAGTFTPRLVRKGQRRLDGLDAMIISLYAGGMTVRDIQHHLASTLSVELSAGTISKITDAVADAVLEWQRRPLEEFYPVIYHRRDPGQGPRQSPGRLPLGSHRGRRRHGRDQARPGHLGPGRGRSLLLGTRVRRAGQQRRERRADRVLRRADGPARGDRGDLAPGHGPDLRGPPDPCLDAVRLRRGPPEGRGRSQGRSAPPRTRRPPGRL